MARKFTRADFAQQNDFCWGCHWPKNGPREDKFQLQTHELVGGAMRKKALREPATYTRLCNTCHAHLPPLVELLALKKIMDPEHYSREKILDLRHEAHTAITEAQVTRAVKRILKRSPPAAF